MPITYTEAYWQWNYAEKRGQTFMEYINVLTFLGYKIL